jgi:mono/diheme cytochrome c family protein
MYKNIRLKFLVLVLSGIIFFSSCYYDNEEYLYGKAPCDLTLVTYSTTVANILATSCYSCHSTATGNASGSGIIIDSYAKLKPYITNGQLSGSINHAGGFSPMPKGATKLSSCDIQKIQSWITAGAPEN